MPVICVSRTAYVLHLMSGSRYGLSLFLNLPGLLTFTDFEVKVNFNHQCVVWFSCSKMHLKCKKESKLFPVNVGQKSMSISDICHE